MHGERMCLHKKYTSLSSPQTPRLKGIRAAIRKFLIRLSLKNIGK
jgi:hypothetical protein